MRKQKFRFTKLAVLSLSVTFTISCKREIAARPGSAVAAASTAQIINPNAVFSGSHDKYAVQSDVTSLLAGQVFSGFKDGVGRDAQFNSPSDVATDAAGSIYVADAANNRIRKITPNGVVSTVAGTGEAGFSDGYAPGAKLNYPTGLAFGPDGSLYIADQGNNRIRKITGATITTIAGTGVAGFSDGPGTGAKFNAPADVAVDATGIVYVADYGNNRIRRIATTGIVTQWVGDGTPGFKDGTGALAELNHPWGIAVGTGGAVYVADAGNNRIRKIVSGVISTLAGGNNTLYAPTGVATDATGNIFVADYGRIRKITPAGVMTNLVGSGYNSYYDSYDTLAAIEPWGLTIDANGVMYVAERTSELIRKITPVPACRILAGSGSKGYQEGKGRLAQFKQPWGVVVDKAGNAYVSDYLDNRIRKITPDGTTNLLAGSGTYGHTDGPGATASFKHPSGLTIDPSGNIYVYEEYSIRKITPAGLVSTITNAVERSGDLVLDPAGNILATSYQNYIYKITPAGVTTHIGRVPDLRYDYHAETYYIPGVSVHITNRPTNQLYVTGYYLGARYSSGYDGYCGGPLDPTPIDINGQDMGRPYAEYIGAIAADPNDRLIIGTVTGKIVDMTAPQNPFMHIYVGQDGGSVSVDGPDSLTAFKSPTGMTFGSNGALYIADSAAHTIRIMSK